MSEKMKEREYLIKRLQKNLSPIRKIAGWTAEELGKKIGVTKQTISNLENGKTPMSSTQYIAIRSAIDYEIANNENEILSKVVALLLDAEEELDEADYAQVQDVVETVAATAAGGASMDRLDKVFDILIKSLPFAASVFTAIIIGTSSSWAKMFFNKGGSK